MLLQKLKTERVSELGKWLLQCAPQYTATKSSFWTQIAKLSCVHSIDSLPSIY